jgi:hypothetical protein
MHCYAYEAMCVLLHEYVTSLDPSTPYNRDALSLTLDEHGIDSYELMSAMDSETLYLVARSMVSTVAVAA